VTHAAVVGRIVGEGHASWTVKGGVTVRRGDDLSLVCSVTGLTTLDVIRVYHRTDGHARTIADNGDVKRPFAVLDRYSVQYTYDNGIGTTRIGYRGNEFSSMCVGVKNVRTTNFVQPRDYIYGHS
jgi:hypothetical protein